MSTARGMAPRDLTRIRFVSDPQLSPDGRLVAFVVTTLSEDQDAYLSNIWVADTGGGPPRRFTTGPLRDTAPRWSPDGSRLAFVSERDPKKKGQLYVMPAQGGEPIRLTELRSGVAHPEWSPDGIHAEDDLRCPMEQGEQLFAALKTLRRDVVLVRFPDETHDMSRAGKPRHRLERFRLILEWFDRHLRVGPATSAPRPASPAGDKRGATPPRR